MSQQPASPPPADDLWRWSAAALAAAIRARQVSSVEAVTSCLARVDAVNGTLNALIDVPRERALAAAAEADRALASGAEVGALHGVPISIKDNVDEAGLLNSGGVAAPPGAPPLPPAAEDAAVVANLRVAGAVSIGRSNVPSFSLRWFSDNDRYGRTLNPWDPTRTPGGSSGGAASAVASGMVPLAHGNDIGGSVRYPAHVCGVMGLRPTVGRIPGWTKPSEQMPGLPPAPALMAVEGVLARTVADLSLGLTAMAVPDLRDPTCVPAPFARSAPLARGTTLGLVRTVEGAPDVHPSHAAALDDAVAMARDAGFRVEEVALPELAEAARLWLLLLHADLQLELGLIRALGGDAINKSMDTNYAVLAETWGTPDVEMYVRGHARRTALVAEVQDVLERYPVILLPASAALAPEHDADTVDASARELLFAQWPSTSIPALGLPALTLPTGVRDGLPVGVQLLGGRFGESALLDVAEALEARVAPLTPIDPKF
jgi:amidase